MAAKVEKVTHERLKELLDYSPETGEFRWKFQRKGRRETEKTTEKLTQAELKELLDYDAKTGNFTWKVKHGRQGSGSSAGALKAVGSGIYRYIRINRTAYMAQRLAWLWVYGEVPSLVRFKDGNSQNCAIANLVDPAERLAGSVKFNQQGSYRYIRIDGEDYPASRLAWFWVNGYWPNLIRFNDGNSENLAFSNLRNALYTTEEKKVGDRVRRTANVDRLRNERLQRAFGISLEKYNEMHTAQDGKCAICGSPETTKRNGKVRWLAVDHCHTSNKVRGLLCGNCNPMIGYARDSVQVLEKAIEYLKGYAPC